jgi:hypothetical protein
VKESQDTARFTNKENTYVIIEPSPTVFSFLSVNVLAPLLLLDQPRADHDLVAADGTRGRMDPFEALLTATGGILVEWSVIFNTKGDTGFVISKAGATLSERLEFSVLPLRTGIEALA